MQYASSHLDVYHLSRVSKNMMWLGRECVIFQITHSLPTLTITTIAKVHFCAGNKSVQPTVDQDGLYFPHDLPLRMKYCTLLRQKQCGNKC